MTAVETKEVADVIQRVQGWPPPLRIALARRILETLESPPAQELLPKLPRGPSAAEIAAMFKAIKPAPTDDEVERIRDEELLRKYGS